LITICQNKREKQIHGLETPKAVRGVVRISWDTTGQLNQLDTSRQITQFNSWFMLSRMSALVNGKHVLPHHQLGKMKNLSNISCILSRRSNENTRRGTTLVE
jgi:hypothetical protein